MTEPRKCRRGHVYVWCRRCGDGVCVCTESPYNVADGLCWCCAEFSPSQTPDPEEPA